MLLVELVALLSELLLELLADELVELLDGLDELDDAAEDAVEELAAALGRKVLWPAPKPMAAAAVPLPPMKIELLSSRLVMTSWPLALSDAVTLALVGRSTLMALRRSATVSVPVEV